MCFSFVVFCFASFRFLLTLLAGETELYVALFVFFHFVCLASFHFVLLHFTSFASLLLLFVSVLSFVSVFSLFSGDGFHCYGFGLRHQSRTASYGRSVLVPWCHRSLRFVSLAFCLCFSCLLLLIVDLQFYLFVYEVVLDGLEQVCACVRVCVCAQCDGPEGLANFFLALLPQSR